MTRGWMSTIQDSKYHASGEAFRFPIISTHKTVFKQHNNSFLILQSTRFAAALQFSLFRHSIHEMEISIQQKIELVMEALRRGCHHCAF